MTTAELPPEAKRALLRMAPRVCRSIHQFAEEEVILPKGPRRGMNFSIDYMPFTRAILDAMESPRWRKLAIVGPTQSGKSLLANNIPILHFLFERQEDIIVGIPHMDLAKGIWQEKVMPVVLGTKYRDLLPESGAGARGGTPTAIQFRNGVWLRFMGAGGGDAQRSSHTARVVIMTEVDKMDDIGEASDESDPVSQIEMRADAFEDSKIVLECTVTTEHGRIWQEAMVSGSAGRIYVPCPACSHYQTLEKDNLIYEEKDVIAAEESARYRCEKCTEGWTDDMRRIALDKPVVVHRGQEIGEGGVVSGDLPNTRTFGLCWNVLYSPMQSLGKTAAQQWEADKSELKEKKKAMCQSKWAMPWKDSDNIKELSVSGLRSRALQSGLRRGELPSWAEWLIFCADVQKESLYWSCEAFRADGSSHLVDYGVVEIQEDTDRSREIALNRLDEIANEGWSIVADTGETVLHLPRLRMIDTGYRPDVIVPWCKNKTRWVPVKGRGEFQVGRMTSGKKEFEIPGIMQARRQTDDTFLWFIDVDETKALAHDRLMLELDKPGAASLPMDCSDGYFGHMCAEVREFGDDGVLKGWQKAKGRRRNDWLDCRSYAVAGDYYLRAVDEQRQKVAEKKRILEERQRKKDGGERRENWIGSRSNFFQ